MNTMLNLTMMMSIQPTRRLTLLNVPEVLISTTFSNLRTPPKPMSHAQLSRPFGSFVTRRSSNAFFSHLQLQSASYDPTLSTSSISANYSA
jgi:hypothetical protein